MEGDIGVQLEATHRAGLGLAADDAVHRGDAAARDPALSPRLQGFAGGALWLAIYGTLVLNFCDFARPSPSARTVRVGNFRGLPVNILVFATVSFVLAGALG
ncbi:hypothetical protein WT11_31995 [Burkholderia stagnalis]|uniref:hypothetical protein n=1 Tax=Burkholderia stagnalis TaxID=1503054 RepID=UPI0007531155|nr:hypothetical protein [Burkholderia stagnalis]KVN26336.1 hypothetical protein WT11_31995 [Burkholderia stagnalis]